MLHKPVVGGRVLSNGVFLPVSLTLAALNKREITLNKEQNRSDCHRFTGDSCYHLQFTNC